MPRKSILLLISDHFVGPTEYYCLMYAAGPGRSILGVPQTAYAFFRLVK